MALLSSNAADRGMAVELKFFIPPDAGCPPLEEVAEGVGFEPTVGITPRSISSRVP